MALNPNLHKLREAGVSIWLDTLSRDLLESGGFAELISDYGVTGATSNPTIFAKAITHSDRYDGQLRELAAGGERDPQELFFSLALDDIRAAARLLRPAYEQSGGTDGFISFECTPDLADDTGATIAQATGLWQRRAHRDQEPRLPRRPLRNGADRPRRDQHDARAHPAGLRRPWHGRAHGRRQPP